MPASMQRSRSPLTAEAVSAMMRMFRMRAIGDWPGKSQRRPTSRIRLHVRMSRVAEYPSSIGIWPSVRSRS